MWFRVFQSQAILYKCSELLLFEGDTPNVYHSDVIASDDERNPLEGDAYCQHRLSVLLFAWTDKDVDRQGFLRIISQVDPLVGSKMPHSVILTYHINSSTEILAHNKHLRLPQAKGQKIQDWWKSVLSAPQYIESAGIPTSLVDLGDIIKGGTINTEHSLRMDEGHLLRHYYRGLNQGYDLHLRHPH